MGSVCCVASRSRGSSRNNDSWSVERNEAHARIGGCFSPPLSSRWEHKFHVEDFASASHLSQQRRASFSASRTISRVGSGHLGSNQGNFSGIMPSNGNGLSDSFRLPQLTPLPSGSILCDSMASASDLMARPSGTSLTKEGRICSGLSTVPVTVESSYRGAGISAPEVIPSKKPLTLQRNYSGNHFFQSKPMSNHFFCRQSSDSGISASGILGTSRMASLEVGCFSQRFGISGECGQRSIGGNSDWWSAHTCSELVASSQKDRFEWADTNNVSDLSWDISQESLDEAGLLAMERVKVTPPGTCPVDSLTNHAEVWKCGLCSRWLLQRSPWSSHRIVASSDLPVVAVLVCGHAYHAECLDRATPDTCRHDPLCPLCDGRKEKVSSKPQGQSILASCTKSSCLTSQISSRGKLSRIGVVTDGMIDSEFLLRNTDSNGKALTVLEVTGRKGVAQSSNISVERGFLAKPLLRKQFSFRGKSSKDTTAFNTGSKKPSSTSQVSPENNVVEDPSAVNWRQSECGSLFQE